MVIRTLVSAIMTTWAAGSTYPVAEVRSALGQAGLLFTFLLKHQTPNKWKIRKGVFLTGVLPFYFVQDKSHRKGSA